jgi:hypothetical protein
MSELKFFLLTRVLIQNFNTMDLVKFLEKNQKLHIQIVAFTLKVTSCMTMTKKRSGNPRFYGQKKRLSYHPAIQPLGSFSHMVACLHVGAPQKI